MINFLSADLGLNNIYNYTQHLPIDIYIHWLLEYTDSWRKTQEYLQQGDTE